MDASRVGVKTIEVSRENLAKQNRRYLAPAKHFRSRASDDQTPETAAAPDFHSSRRQHFKLTEISDIDNIDLYVDARGDPSDISRTGNAVLRPVDKNDQPRQTLDFRLRYLMGQQYFW